MSRPILVAALLGLAAPLDAGAADGRVFEADARGEPRLNSVSLSGEAGSAGASAPTGTDGPPAPAPAGSPPSTQPGIVLRPRIYVKDLDHMAELMKRDPAVGAMAASLVHRRNAAVVVGVAGMALSVGLGIAAMNASSASGPAAMQSGKSPPGQDQFVASMVALGVGSLLAVIIHPSRGELLDVVNAWNRAHLDEPFDLQYEPMIVEPAASAAGSGVIP
jgi:hypothetical protein